jgi:hypothetical protein
LDRVEYGAAVPRGLWKLSKGPQGPRLCAFSLRGSWGSASYHFTHGRHVSVNDGGRLLSRRLHAPSLRHGKGLLRSTGESRQVSMLCPHMKRDVSG